MFALRGAHYFSDRYRFRLKPGEIDLSATPTTDANKHYAWGGINRTTRVYVHVRPVNGSDETDSFVKIKTCSSGLWDYYVEDRRDGLYKVWLWNNGYRRSSYDGHYIGASFGNDTSDIEWSSFAKVDGNNGDVRDAVMVFKITEDYTPGLISYTSYDADGHKITLPYWAEKYFSGKPTGHGTDSVSL